MCIENFIKKLVGDIKILQVNMIYLIHKVLVLLKITSIFKKFLRTIIDFYGLRNNQYFSEHIMMENLRPEEENKNKDVRNLFRLVKLKKEAIDTTVKDIQNLFRLEKENKANKDVVLRDIRNLSENEEEEINFWNNN